MTPPPFRGDHVGSFLRPQYLLDARAKRASGQITADELRQVEDRAISEIVAFQRDAGLKSITDGEFRRTTFHLDFLEQLAGVEVSPVTTRITETGQIELVPPVIRVTGKIKHVKDIQKRDFEYLKSQVDKLAPGCIPKVCIPSPTMLHFRGGRAGISLDSYPTLEPHFFDDVAQAYAEELKSLYDAGCRYVQLDDTNLAYLCDAKMRAGAQSRGDEPNELVKRYATFINKVVALKPKGMTLCMHLCRGNFQSTHAASGGYEPVAEELLSTMELDGYFLEYDDERSGDFRPLRFLKPGKIAVLGLVTSKFGKLESKEDLKRRIKEASQYAPLAQLALSPQCGFSSTVHGNKIETEDQMNKLKLVVETAGEVWKT